MQGAKQRFGELVRRAQSEGPQVVTKHGEEVVVVVPSEEWKRLKGPKKDFKESLMSMPAGFEDRDLERPRNDYPRDDGRIPSSVSG